MKHHRRFSPASFLARILRNSVPVLGTAVVFWILSPPASAMIQICGSSSHMYGTSIVPCGVNNYFVAGFLGGGETDVFVMKMNGDGGVEWRFAYSARRDRTLPYSNHYRIQAVERSPDGAFSWVGLAALKDGGAAVVVDSALIRLNADGSPRWTRQYFPNNLKTTIFSSVVEQGEGDLILCGVNVHGSGNFNDDHILIMRLSADGQTVKWVKEYPDFKGERHPGFIYAVQRNPGSASLDWDECLYLGTRMIREVPNPKNPKSVTKEIQGLVARIEMDGAVGWCRSLDTGRTGEKKYDRNGLGGIMEFQALGVIRNPRTSLFDFGPPSYDLIVCLGQKVWPITHDKGEAVLVSRLTGSGDHVWSRLIHSDVVDGFNRIKAVLPVRELLAEDDLILAGESTEFQPLRRIMNFNAFLLKVTGGGGFGWIRSLGLVKRTYSNEERVDDYANAATWGPAGDVLFAGASESFSKPEPWYVKLQPSRFDLMLGRIDLEGGVGQGEGLVAQPLFEPPKKVKFETMPGGGALFQPAAPLIPPITILTGSYSAVQLDCQERDLGLGGTTAKVAPGFTETESGTREIFKNGKASWEYDGSTGLIKVWASAYADIVEQFKDPSWIYSDQASIKVTDYRMLEVTGTPGAWYRADVTLDGVFKGIVDRVDYTLPVGGSATKYDVELVVGFADTNDVRSVSGAHGLVQRVWERHNSLLADFLTDAAWAVVGGAVSLGIGAATPARWIGGVILDGFTTVVLNTSLIGNDVISADECANRTFHVVFKNLLLQGGRRYTVYAFLHGTVSAVSTAIAAGVCEMDFWHHPPHISDSGDEDRLRGRGFKLQGVSLNFENLTDYPPTAPAEPSPANGAAIDITGSKEAPTIPVLSWTCADPEGASLDYQLYFGESFPLPHRGEFGHFSKAVLSDRLKPNTTYYWKILVRDNGKLRTEGPLWSFSTGNVNLPPAFKIMLPKDGATGEKRKMNLFWDFYDPNGDPVTYDLYLGMSSPPPLLHPNYVHPAGTPRYTIGGLEPDTTYYWSLKARDPKDGRSEGPVYTFTTEGLSTNQPALLPVDIWPPDGAVDVPFQNPVFKWTGGDPDGDFLVCSIQLNTTEEPWNGPGYPGMGTCTPPQPFPPMIHLYGPEMTDRLYAFTFTPSGALERGRQYWWRIISDNLAGGRVGAPRLSPVMTFRTKPNTPPAEPAVVTPGLNSRTGKTNVVLTWRCLDADGDSLKYDVYLAAADELIANPKIPLIAADLDQATFTVAGPLRPNTTYYWEIVAKDGYRGETKSRTFVFKTGS